MILFFGELSPAGGQVVGRSSRVVMLPFVSSVGWCRLSFSSGGVVVFPLLLGGAAFLLSSGGWCSFFGSWCFHPCKLWAGALFFRERAPPKGGGSKAARPKEGGGQVAPPEREERESRTTEREAEGPPLHSTELNLR